ncbi:MAG: GTPase ObgE [Spirochaetes bacterium]|nr:GTPase ObgE [Spirochaetota bacterium]
MDGFVDETTIVVASGSGGDGAVSFRREKYVPRGGPDGGDGGRGGDVVFSVRANLRTLAYLKLRHRFLAEDGGGGSGQRKHGRDGRDVEVAVPPGTVLHDASTGGLIADLSRDGERFVCLRGGRGGKGNWHFRTPVNQAPRFAQKGVPGETRELRVEMQVIADAGLVGKPNAGKSTLLSVLTNARPKVADYPFTTRSPHLGLLRRGDRDVVLADIPGIIEGAASGRGLGLRFLRHVERCTVLLYLVDLGDEGAADTVRVLETELAAFSAELAARPRLIVGTKLDREGAPARLAGLIEAFSGDRVLGISAIAHEGLDELARAVIAITGGQA